MKKVQRVVAKTSAEASRGYSFVRDAIALVNDIPRTWKPYAELAALASQFDEKIIRAGIAAVTLDMPRSIQEHLSVARRPMRELLFRYGEIEQLRDLLREVALINESQQSLPCVLNTVRLVGLSILDETGTLRPMPSPLLDRLDGADMRRVRACASEKCQRLFYQVRRDQTTCSRSCARLLRNRKWRTSYQSRYKQNRYAKAERAETQRQRHRGDR